MNEAAAAPEATFALIDWLVLITYTLGVTGVGLWMARGQSSNRDYFLGGRNLPWWVVGLSIIATETSALTFIGLPAASIGAIVLGENGQLSVAGGTIGFLLVGFGYFLGRVIVAFAILPMYFKGDVYTPYQLLGRAFGPVAQRTASAFQLVGMALAAGVRVLVPAIAVTIVLQTSFPGWNIYLSVAVIMLVALFYTSIGGIKSVVWTDMIQYFIFIGGGIFAMLYIPTLLKGNMAAPSGATGWGAVGEVAGHITDTENWWKFGIDFEKSFSENFSLMFTGPYNLFMSLIPVTIGIVFAFGFDQLNVQRVLGCKDKKESAKAMLLSAVLIAPQFFVFLMVGVVLFAFYTILDWNMSLPPWDTTINAETPKATADYVFPIWIVTYAPPVVKGFLIAGVLSAAMSSISSALTAMSSMVVMDFTKKEGQDTSDGDGDSSLMISRIATIAAGVALSLVALACRGNESILSLAFKVAGITGGGILGAFIYTIIVRRGHFLPVVAGIVAAFLFMTGLNYLMGSFAFFMPPENLKVVSITWPWHVVIGMAVCMLVAFATLPFFKEPTGQGLDAEYSSS